MTAGPTASSRPGTGATDDGDRVADDTDVLRRLRSGTAAEHRAVEDALDLLSPELTRERLADVLARLPGFWRAAEHGLEAWARRHPADAERVQWSQRRRTPLFEADLAALGA